MGVWVYGHMGIWAYGIWDGIWDWDGLMGLGWDGLLRDGIWAASIREAKIHVMELSNLEKERQLKLAN